MDIEELDKRMSIIEKQQSSKQVEKVIKSINKLETVLLLILSFPIIGALLLMVSNTDPIIGAFYFAVASICVVGIVLVILMKCIFVELIRVEMVTRIHQRDGK